MATRMDMTKLLILALLSVPTHAVAHEPDIGTWKSYPRAAITIVIDEKGARIIGPGWERTFTPTRGRLVRIQLDEESWFFLRLRRDGKWVGTYYHPAVRAVEKGQVKRHLMLLTRE
jgi:hypothetical protein